MHLKKLFCRKKTTLFGDCAFLNTTLFKELLGKGSGLLRCPLVLNIKAKFLTEGNSLGKSPTIFKS